MPRVFVDPRTAESRQSLASRDRTLFGKSNRLVATFLFTPASGAAPFSPLALVITPTWPFSSLRADGKPAGIDRWAGEGLGVGGALIKLQTINWLMSSCRGPAGGHS